MSERFLVAERQVRVQALPILMLSPAGQLTLDDSVTAGRNCQTLSTPTPVGRFISAVNSLVAVGAVRKAA